jgi:hypothetical protein
LVLGFRDERCLRCEVFCQTSVGLATISERCSTNTQLLYQLIV